MVKAEPESLEMELDLELEAVEEAIVVEEEEVGVKGETDPVVALLK